MPLTQAERQRLYRERLRQNNPEKYLEMEKRNRERIKNNYVKISMLPEDQQAKRRKTWRKLKKYQNNKNNDEEKENKNETKSRKEYHQNYNKIRKLLKTQKEKIEKLKTRVNTLQKKDIPSKFDFKMSKELSNRK